MKRQVLVALVVMLFTRPLSADEQFWVFNVFFEGQVTVKVTGDASGFWGCSIGKNWTCAIWGIPAGRNWSHVWYDWTAVGEFQEWSEAGEGSFRPLFDDVLFGYAAYERTGFPSNLSSGVGLIIGLRVPPPPELQISPDTTLESSGDAGGPFTPGVQRYDLASVDGEVSWLASADADWVVLSAESGELAGGETAPVDVTIGPKADELDSGLHTATVTFINVNRCDTFTRQVILTVAPVLRVSPAAAFESSGEVGGLFDPGSHRYELTSVGGHVSWNASVDADWVDLSAQSGELDVGETVPVYATIAPEALLLDVGVHTALVTFTNDDSGAKIKREVILTVAPGLVVSPGEPFESSGPAGGPFTSLFHCFELTSVGADVRWEASVDADWLVLSDESGALGAGKTARVCVMIGPQAEAMEEGVHTALVTFTNLESGHAITRQVILTVEPPGQ